MSTNTRTHTWHACVQSVPSYTAAHAYAAMAVAGAVRGFMHRMAVRDVWDLLGKEDLSFIGSENEEGAWQRCAHSQMRNQLCSQLRNPVRRWLHENQVRDQTRRHL